MENKKVNNKKKNHNQKNNNKSNYSKNSNYKSKSNYSKKSNNNQKKKNQSNSKKTKSNNKPSNKIKTETSIKSNKKVETTTNTLREEVKKEKKVSPKRKKIKIKVVIIFLLIIFLLGAIYISIYLYQDYKAIQNSSLDIDNIPLDKGLDENIDTEKDDRIAKLKELQKENNEIIGWLEIADTRINYPVLQTDNNDFYLDHDYKKQYSVFGSLFLDKNFDLDNGSSNYLIYGHRAKNGLMFEDLYKYAKKDFYTNHKQIRFTTLKEDATYEILAVFYSRVYYVSETNVFRYYFFVNAKNEKEYNDYVNNAKNASIYDTGVTAKYGDQLLTLSTCEYSQTDGRFVVVAKKIS